MKSANQKPADQELQVADLLGANEQLELRLEAASDEAAALRQCPAQSVAVRRIHDEGDEANGAALWH